MADPITLIGVGLGLLGGLAGSGAFSGSKTTTKEPAAAPKATAPAATPAQAKPTGTGIQSTFLSGVAGSALPGGTSGSRTNTSSGSGKTLIGQ